MNRDTRMFKGLSRDQRVNRREVNHMATATATNHQLPRRSGSTPNSSATQQLIILARGRVTFCSDHREEKTRQTPPALQQTSTSDTTPSCQPLVFPHVHQNLHGKKKHRQGFEAAR